MKKMLCLVCFCVSGCASSVWVGQNSVSDWQDCQINAARQFPPVVHTTQVGVGYTSPTYTTCQTTGNTTQCKTTGGHYTPPAIVSHDANLGARNHYIRQCMTERGNSLMTGEDYENFKKRYPDDTTPVQKVH